MAEAPGNGHVEDLGRGRYSVSDGTARRIAYAAGPAHARWVFLAGQVYVIKVATTGSPGADSQPGGGRDDGMALAAPMPATVAAIPVAPGQDVSQGDVLVMLEAMKMELPIRAPRAGRVRRVLCSPGELVQPGVPLVELE